MATMSEHLIEPKPWTVRAVMIQADGCTREYARCTVLARSRREARAIAMRGELADHAGRIIRVSPRAAR